ncbi:hypothetical protein [Paenibacillus sp. OV219]|uniref:hypothetical protein n=1 Tax=Paenibacillus sp. OV219 TaxID=1884377 RepID=UPI0008B0261A|nr:hypothetical protein [Paenibacillus sp. OV219]SEO93772.1 hypothetical protein SAMN05518847_11329 [Paenibacillus sp. OV219]
MKKAILLVCVAIVAFFAVMFVVDYDHGGFQITINNNLDKDVRHLSIEYPGGPKVITVSAHSTKHVHLVPDVHGEASINLVYETGQGKQSTAIFGYIEPGYKGEAVINIDSLKDNGELDLTIKENLDNY